MGTKKYTSYAEIEIDLEILKLEKEINYNKIKLNFEKTKENIMPSKVVSLAGNFYKTIFSGTTGTVLQLVIPFVMKWFSRKHRNS